MVAFNYSTFIWYIVGSYSAMDGCTAINLVSTCQNCFCPTWCCLRCMMAFAGAFTAAQTQNLDEDSFDMLYKTDC